MGEGANGQRFFVDESLVKERLVDEFFSAASRQDVSNQRFLRSINTDGDCAVGSQLTKCGTRTPIRAACRRPRRPKKPRANLARDPVMRSNRTAAAVARRTITVGD